MNESRPAPRETAKRPYVKPVVERHDEWHLLTGFAPS